VLFPHLIWINMRLRFTFTTIILHAELILRTSIQWRDFNRFISIKTFKTHICAGLNQPLVHSVYSNLARSCVLSCTKKSCLFHKLLLWSVLFEEGGLGDLEFQLPFFFLGSGSTLRQTEDKLDPLCCAERCG
jgi:hypothetical protein